jgi:site-specific recombinase XerD
MTLVAPTLQAYFSDRLAMQLQASPRTIASYRDTLRLLLCFVQERTGRAPSALDWDELDEPLIAAFLNHLEVERHNSARTRNLRLTAIRSLFSYAALRHPEHAAVIQRVLSIPPKRFERRTVTFLTAEETQTLIDAPDQLRWEGRRDCAMLILTIQAGLRVSELVGLGCGDVARVSSTVCQQALGSPSGPPTRGKESPDAVNRGDVAVPRAVDLPARSC